MEDNNKRKSFKYLLIGTLVLFLSILGASMAYYLARVQGNLSGRAAGTELDLTITKLSTNANGDLIPLDNDLETLNLAVAGYQDKGACVDINGYSVCQIYKITVTNNGTVPLDITGGVQLVGANTPNIDCAKMASASTITSNNSCKGADTLASNETLNANSSKDYFVMVYINNLDEPQYDSGEFIGTVSFVSTQGKRVKARFNETYNAAEFIKDKFDNDTEKITIDAADGVQYRYATTESLMYDRLGGTTTELEDGNLRFYGSSPNNYIDIGDRGLDNEIILWRIIGVFDGKIRVIRNESIGQYSWDTSSPDINGGNGINQWGSSGTYEGADLMKLLNPGYDNNQDSSCSDCQWNASLNKYECNCDETQKLVNNSLWWNSESGMCYNNRNNNMDTCDFTNTGLSEEVKDLVDNQVLYFGRRYKNNGYASQAYKEERESVYTNNINDGIKRTLTWTGKVGLIYPSDYGYSTDLGVCDSVLNLYNNSNCINNNWIKIKEKFEWTIIPVANNGDTGVLIYKNGMVTPNIISGAAHNVKPVLYLKSNVVFESGKGTEMEPYIAG